MVWCGVAWCGVRADCDGGSVVRVDFQSQLLFFVERPHSHVAVARSSTAIGRHSGDGECESAAGAARLRRDLEWHTIVEQRCTDARRGRGGEVASCQRSAENESYFACSLCVGMYRTVCLVFHIR